MPLPSSPSRSLLTGLACLLLPLTHSAETLIVDGANPAALDSNPGTESAPLKTIAKAASLVAPGQRIVIKGGIYREAIMFTTSGTTEQRITMTAAPGERAVISGADVITGWKRCSIAELPHHADPSKVWYVDLDWEPADLYVDGDRLPLQVASWPTVDNEGKDPDNHHHVETGGPRTLIDTKHLNQPAGYWVGGKLLIHRYWLANGKSVSDQYMNADIIGYDPATHALALSELSSKNQTLDPTVKQIINDSRPIGGVNKDVGMLVSDWYRIANLPTLIEKPGQFVVTTSGEQRRMFVWPPDGVDLGKQLVEGSRRDIGLRGQNVSFVSFIGLEVRGVTHRPLAFDHGEHNEIAWCTSHNNRAGSKGEAFGIYLSEQQHSSAHNNLSLLNGYGVVVYQCDDSVVERNVTGRNMVDAFVVSWNSHRVHVANNYAFDNWDQAHPDGFQTYRAVVDLTLDSNLFMSVGQGWQSSETQGPRVINNVWAGMHHGGGINFGKRPSEVATMEPNQRILLQNNTIFSGAVSTGFEGQAFNNIRLSNIGITADGACDHNLYNTRSTSTAAPYGQDGKETYSKSFAEWQEKVKPNSVHDRVGAVRFRNGPAFEIKAANGETGGGTEFKISGGTSGFAAGDHIELDCDGVVRTVLSVTPTGIILQPAPAAKQCHGSETIVWNWKDKADFTLDIRLADDSPGKGMAKDGGDVGSNLDVQAYMRGDFDNDGKRDVPDMPPEVRKNHQGGITITRFLRW